MHSFYTVLINTDWQGTACSIIPAKPDFAAHYFIWNHSWSWNIRFETSEESEEPQVHNSIWLPPLSTLNESCVYWPHFISYKKLHFFYAVLLVLSRAKDQILRRYQMVSATNNASGNLNVNLLRSHISNFSSKRNKQSVLLKFRQVSGLEFQLLGISNNVDNRNPEQFLSSNGGHH